MSKFDIIGEQGQIKIDGNNGKFLDVHVVLCFRRQILDDDNREVKFLQELLLEDGEMHGTGRKRQFRWKTLGTVATWQRNVDF
jgi:hypothetical protein